MPNESKPPFTSEHEAYTHLLIKQQEMADTMKNIEMQMSFLLMNIRKGNFRNPRKGNFQNPSEQVHAMKELGYLLTGANRMSTQAGELWALGMHLKHLLERASEDRKADE